MIRWIAAGLLLCAPLSAQESIPGAESLFDGHEDGDIMREDWENGILIPLDRGEITREENARVRQGSAAVLRGLDRLTGTVRDIELGVGETRGIGRLRVTLTQCRYPEANPSGDAYAWLEIRDPRAGEPEFRGWMIASAPALNPLDHPRYDVWVIRCST